MTGGKIEVLRPDWALPVEAGFTTRCGGVSKAPYDSLNLAMHVGDDPAAVRENRRRLVEQARLPEAPRWVSQVHGTRVVHASEVEPDVTEADAVWTDQPGQVCAVLVADCLPILLADHAGRCVAAVHAGWRGLAAGIIQRTIETLPVPASGLVACIGPCIGPDAYEVGAEVIQAMISGGAVPVRSPSPPSANRFQLDLAATADGVLRQYGVEAVTRLERCTSAEHEAVYSYRRSGVTGRIAGYVSCPG
ncbi:peptidoglycan editing factor PgeF [Spiribacter onubensis]|uniref:Purine nucleoside phosphorylase n=1 Tax=Spiribacter onubensis TaxID=3122420 RepID=A0ABV3S9B6_9GAMM